MKKIFIILCAFLFISCNDTEKEIMDALYYEASNSFGFSKNREWDIRNLEIYKEFKLGSTNYYDCRFEVVIKEKDNNVVKINKAEFRLYKNKKGLYVIESHKWLGD